MPMGLPHRIAIVGAGLIGSALAGHLILAGNKVIIGARRPDAFTPPDYQREDIDYPVRTIEEAIDGAEVAILAIPNAAVASFAEVYRDRLAGAVIIDPSNPFLLARRRCDDHQAPRRQDFRNGDRRVVPEIIGGTRFLTPARRNAVAARSPGTWSMGDRVRGRRQRHRLDHRRHHHPNRLRADPSRRAGPLGAH